MNQAFQRRGATPTSFVGWTNRWRGTHTTKSQIWQKRGPFSLRDAVLYQWWDCTTNCTENWKSSSFSFSQPLRIGHIALEILTSRQSGECALTIGSRLDGGTVKMASLFLQKNSPYTETFNEKYWKTKEIESVRWYWSISYFRIILLSETGLLKKSYSENGLKPTVQRCVQRQVTRVKQSAISLYDLYSTFIVLGIGISLSILAFLVELIMARLGRGRQGWRDTPFIISTPLWYNIDNNHFYIQKVQYYLTMK